MRIMTNDTEDQNDLSSEKDHSRIMSLMNHLHHFEINSNIQTNNVIKPMRLTQRKNISN